MKIWPTTETEPDSWLITKDGRYNSYLEGSVLLLSHHVDVTFGNVSIVPYDATEGPPEIAGVKVSPEPKGATIRWFTDEPATGKIDFGETSAYGRSVSDGIGTSHSLYLPNLDPKKVYHFKITVTDSSNDSASTDDDTFETQELIPLVSDDFNACELDPAWEFINPLADGSYEVNGSQAMISVPGGSNHDIYPPGPPLNRAPHLMRAVTDPGKLKVKFDTGIAAAIEQQGILVEEDGQNFFRVNYQYKNDHLQLVAIGFRNNKPEHMIEADLNGTSDGPFYLLLTRQAGQWQLAHSTDDENWSDVGTFSFPLSVTKAGFYAGNASKTPGEEPAFTTAVDYFFNADTPIVPEDGNPLILPVSIVGNGSVTKDPVCGNPVTLTAEADPGWKFVEWQGSPIDGRIDLQITTPFEFGDEVTAVFAEGEPETYSLNLDVDGQGSVLLDPAKAEYIRGETVELTADPADGWEFTSWGGDLSGTAPVQTVLMDDDKNVTATFTHTEFNLVVTVVGPGQVQISPPGPYDYGEKVKLTAVPNVGSLASFAGWSGDVNSTDNPLKLEMTDNLELTATFITYQQFMPVTMSQFGS